MCEPSAGAANNGGCSGYIAGAADQLELWRAEQKKKSCIPDGVRSETLIEIVKNYLKAYPEDRHFPGASIVRFALVKAYRTCAD